MKVNDSAIELVKFCEGLHDGDLTKIGLQPKRCPAGIWTCCYGHALRDSKGNFLRKESDKDEAYRQAGNLTEADAEALLVKDLEIFSTGVQHLVLVPVTDNQFGALVSLSYNIGLGNFADSTLRKKLNNKDYAGAADQFIRWNKSDGKVLRGLTIRRKREQDLFNRADV
jgi:lysozyme